MDGLGDSNPYVEQADAGEDAADGTVAQGVAERGVVEDDGVGLPDAGPPGEDGDHAAKVDAEDDEHDQREALQPDRRGRGRVGCGLQIGLRRHQGKVSHYCAVLRARRVKRQR